MQTIYDAKILIVDDNQDLLNLVTTALRSTGYNQLTACTGCAAAQAAFAANRPDLMILDINLPDGDGFTLFRTLHSMADIPALFLSARDADADRLFGLGLGTDDYLTKPFSVEELLARLRVSLRRVRYDSEKVDEAASIYQNGGLKIDYAAGCTYQNGKEIHLTPIEYKLLCLLAKNVGKVLTHNFILKEVWGSALPGDTPSLRVFMATLRKKIEPVPAQPKYIQTHVGVGYRMLRIAEGEPVQKNG